jgi:single-stranded-DNA-specific exonuclease
MWKLRNIDQVKARQISSHFGYQHSIAEILVGRNYDTLEKVTQFTNVSLDSLGSPFVLHGMLEASDRIIAALKSSQSILIHGDFRCRRHHIKCFAHTLFA